MIGSAAFVLRSDDQTLLRVLKPIYNIFYFKIDTMSGRPVIRNNDSLIVQR